MFQALLFALLTVLISQPAEQSGTSDIEVIEVFRAETVEELEAALTDGYPMPWLEEILNDDTIPEEDRYWLDCRVRAVIAQDLHLFYDREGNPVHVEADWVAPGEDYWREHMIINPVGEYDASEINSETGLYGEIGRIISNHGESIGELALFGIGLHLSRDGSIATAVSRRIIWQGETSPINLIILKSDGNYLLPQVSMIYARCALSNSGNYILMAVDNGRDETNKAYLFSRSGEILWERELELRPVGNVVPIISPDDRYCAVATYSRERRLIQLFDVETGEEMFRETNIRGFQMSFSPNGRYLNLSGMDALTINTETGNVIWTDQLIQQDVFPVGRMLHLDCDNNGNLFAADLWPLERSGSDSTILALFNQTGEVLISDQLDGNMDISPNGHFVLSENYQPRSERSVIPVVIRSIIMGGE